MMRSEFIFLTGFEPSEEEYKEIEKNYMNSALEKREFCTEWLRDNGIKKCMDARLASIEELKKVVSEKDATIKKLERQLDMELEWHPYGDCGTSFSQADYEGLRSFCKEDGVWSDEKAKYYLEEEFGFSMERVNIIHTVHTYEVNKHHKLRVLNTYERVPLYNATDWNYIRFDCQGWMWECVNGELCRYTE